MVLEKEEILQFLRDKKDAFFSDYKLVKLGLFGSFGRNEAHENSDIDIIVEFENNTPDLHEKKSELRQIIKNHFNKEVDLCREKYLKPYYRERVLKSAIYV